MSALKHEKNCLILKKSQKHDNFLIDSTTLGNHFVTFYTQCNNGQIKKNENSIYPLFLAIRIDMEIKKVFPCLFADTRAIIRLEFMNI